MNKDYSVLNEDNCISREAVREVLMVNADPYGKINKDDAIAAVDALPVNSMAERSKSMIGLALCSHKNNGYTFLFQMPRCATLKKGDRVVVETKNGETEAIVVETASTVFMNDDEYRMIIRATGAKEPLRRVLKKVTYEELKYDDEDLGAWDRLKEPEEETENE